MNCGAVVALVVLLTPGVQTVGHIQCAKGRTTQQLSSVLQDSVPEYALHCEGLVRAIATVAARFRIPMGIVVVANRASRARVDRRWDRIPPYAILAQLAKGAPGYRISVGHGVVHFLPTVLPSTGKNFLDIRIPDFDVADQLVELVDRRLLAATQRVVSPPAPTSGPASVAGSQFSSPRPRISLRLRNATVRQILDALVTASSHKLWIVAFPGQDGETPTGYLRTSSIDGKFVPEDHNQPAWETVPWGIDPLTYENLAP